MRSSIPLTSFLLIIFLFAFAPQQLRAAQTPVHPIPASSTTTPQHASDDEDYHKGLILGLIGLGIIGIALALAFTATTAGIWVLAALLAFTGMFFGAHAFRKSRKFLVVLLTVLDMIGAAVVLVLALIIGFLEAVLS